MKLSLPTAPNGLRYTPCLDQSAIGLADWHRTVSFVQPGFQSFENTLLYYPRMRPFRSYFPFITNTIASKSRGSAVKSLLSDFYPCAINIQPRPSTIAFPKLTHYLSLSLRERGRTRGFAEYVLRGGKPAEYLNIHW